MNIREFAKELKDRNAMIDYYINEYDNNNIDEIELLKKAMESAISALDYRKKKGMIDIDKYADELDSLGMECSSIMRAYNSNSVSHSVTQDRLFDLSIYMIKSMYDSEGKQYTNNKKLYGMLADMYIWALKYQINGRDFTSSVIDNINNMSKSFDGLRNAIVEKL